MRSICSISSSIRVCRYFSSPRAPAYATIFSSRDMTLSGLSVFFMNQNYLGRRERRSSLAEIDSIRDRAFAIWAFTSRASFIEARRFRLERASCARTNSRSVKMRRVSSALASIPLMTFSMDLSRYCNPPNSVLRATSFLTSHHHPPPLERFTFFMNRHPSG